MAAGFKAVLPRLGWSVLALAALSPLLVAAYSMAVPFAPMRGQEGTWSSNVWQRDLPSGFRTRLRDGTLTFYPPDAADGTCGPSIGAAPALAEDRDAESHGSVAGTRVAIRRDHGSLALAYDQYDPWVFFSRGPTPRRTVTVRFHQTATTPCAD